MYLQKIVDVSTKSVTILIDVSTNIYNPLFETVFLAFLRPFFDDFSDDFFGSLDAVVPFVGTKIGHPKWD